MSVTKKKRKKKKETVVEKDYKYRDGTGMLWRFDGARPVSKLADDIMKEVGLA